MLLRVEKLSKQYSHADGPVDALKDVTFNVEEGMFVTITGPSGSGKSTLLLTLGGLIYPSSGHIFLETKRCTLHPIMVWQGFAVNTLAL
ncbi:MAG: ATP-binding cassette domain-containing protein [Deltaproteobacteria bacterium]|nr:ATP-binding cassette domain-containing protein [Deltaproteobacteria bacterium]